MELVSSRDEFPFLKNFTRSPSLLSPMWQKLPYICNNFFHYSNLRITFLNYCTIEKSPSMGCHKMLHLGKLGHIGTFNLKFF